MNEVFMAERVKELTRPILEKGFLFEYFYQKGGDSSCVYICRFKKGKDYLDWREVSGGDEINIVVCVGGEFHFPSLKSMYPKRYRAFRWKHLFRNPTVEEKRVFIAELLCEELGKGETEFFGIKL
ncbi:MAG: hypothetical protein E7377_03815 [Clostridiales bacterium]|nr:hypothetical protein [Clostridiales bacterium]